MSESDPKWWAAELRKGWDGDPWHGPGTLSLVEGLDAAAAAARPAAPAHSIWELVLHMTSWQNEVRRRLAGAQPAQPEEGDWPAVGETSPAAWRGAVSALGASLEELARAVEELPPSVLDRPVGATRDAPLGTGVSCREMIHGLVQHNAYHSGQVAVLRKALGI